MRRKLFSIFMAVVIALSLMPTAIFAVDEEGGEDLSANAVSYYIGSSQSGTVSAGSKAVYKIDTSSLEDKACTILVSNTSEDGSATLTYSILDSSGAPKTEISTAAACYDGSASFDGADSSFDLSGNEWYSNFFNLSTGDLIVLEAGSADASFTFSVNAIYSPTMVSPGEFFTKSFDNHAHLINLYLEDYPGKETVFIQNNSEDEFRHFILSGEKLVKDADGDDWGYLEPEYWNNRAINFNTAGDYYLLIIPMSNTATYSYEEYYDDDDYDDDDDYYDDEDDDYYYDDDDDYYYDDDDDYYYDDDDEYYDDDDDYYDDDDDDYDDEDDYYDYAVAISPQDLKYYSITAADKTYNGKAQQSKPEVAYEDILLGTSMYSVSYSNNKNVGTAKMTIKGVAPNSGTVTKTFKINPKGTSVSKLTAARKAITVKWKKQSAKMSKTRISGYEIQYSTSSKFTNAKKKVVKGYKSTTKKLSGLKAKKKYYVRIRTYKKVGGKKYYSPWSKYKSIKTK